MFPESKGSFFRKSNPSKERGQSIVIPNIPKVVDERARVKLLCDYDKYEAELFKHHLGTPDTTATVGLRNVPADFDRRVPTRNEPTVAEREYDAHRKSRKGKKCDSISPPRPAQPSKRGAAESQLAAGEAVRKTTVARARTPTMPSVPMPEHVLPPRSLRGRQSLRGTAESTFSPAPTPPSLSRDSRRMEASTAREITGDAVMAAPTPTEAKKSLPKRLERPLSLKKAQKYQVDEKKEPLKPMLQQSLLRPLSPWGKNTDTVGGSTSSPGLLSPKRDAALTAEHCGQLLRILLCTPPEYSESFHLDLTNIDLRWMQGMRYPNSFVTLHSWRSPDDNGDEIPSLNSPRSVIVLLQNGVVVKDLVLSGTIHDDPLLPRDPDMRHMVKQMRVESNKRFRDRLVESLRDKYLDLCRRVNMADIVKSFHADKKQDTAVALPTYLKKDHERRQRALESERKRLEKQLNFVKDVHARQLVAEERRRQVEEEAQAKIEAKKAEEQAAQLRAAERLAIQRKKLDEKEEFYKKALEERQARAAEKYLRRVEAQQRMIEHNREQREQLAKGRQERFKRVAELQERQKLIIQQKHEAKEEKLQRLREEKERRQQELHTKVLERAAKSLELRELVRQRAALHEEKIRQAAEEQQRKVEERLMCFQQSCKEARLRRMQEEAEKRVRMKEAFLAAVQKVNAFKEEIIEKQTQHEKLFDKIQRQREGEILTRREREREDMEAKSFAVLRNKRIAEYGKLETVLQLLSRHDAAIAVEKEREVLKQETRRAREAMAAERSALREEISRQVEVMQ